MTIPHDDPHPTSLTLSPAEATVYGMICEAAAAGQPCPVNIDLEIAAGFNSTSMGSKTVQRLEAKGLIVVERLQRARRVQVVQTGQWTAWPEWHRAGEMRTDRGGHDTGPLLTALEALGIDRETALGRVQGFKALVKLSKDLEAALRLAERRIGGHLVGL